MSALAYLSLALILKLILVKLFRVSSLVKFLRVSIAYYVRLNE